MVYPTNQRSAFASVGRLGLVDPHAQEYLQRLSWWPPQPQDYPENSHRELLIDLSRSPDADNALRGLIRLADSLGPQWSQLDRLLHIDHRLRSRLFSVLGVSLGLTEHLITHPQTWTLLTQEFHPFSQESLSESFHECLLQGPAETTIERLRIHYRNYLLQLASRDLEPIINSDIPALSCTTVGQQLAHLADASLNAALILAQRTLCPKTSPPALAIISMGKCGAQELNYVSDVDVIFVGQDGSALTNSIAREVMRIASQAFFTVDAGLRPEGRLGPLVRSLESHITYYQRWAKTWEFQALLKARFSTGDHHLAHQYLNRLMPLVWTACERENFVPDVQAMRRRVSDHVPVEIRHRELKLGPGGLRDIEFAVQLLQLVHGDNDETLRVRSTMEALVALATGGYISDEDSADLETSYEFLRLLEHRLQLQRLKRTHLLPADDDTEGMRWLARAAHISPTADKDATAVLRQELKRHNIQVSKLHTKLFYQPLLEAINPANACLSRKLTIPGVAERQLGALGYQAPQNVLTHLSALTKQTGRTGRIQAVLLPQLLYWLSNTPDPDGGVLAYRRLSEAMTHYHWYLPTLRDSGAVAKRLMRILGTSAYIPDLLLHTPEVITEYTDGPHGPKLLDHPFDAAARALVSSAARYSQPHQAIDVACNLRRYELARIASADILGMLEVHEVCRALTEIWTAVLQASLEAIIRHNHNHLPCGRISVIGMGRIGGQELGYGSDADVIFICDPFPGIEDSQAIRWASSIIEQLRNFLTTPSVNPPLNVDINLRPEGRLGPSVRTLASYQAYYTKWAQPWEFQALLRARPIAGDQELGQQFIDMIDQLRYPKQGISSSVIHEICRIKARVDVERLPHGADVNTHTKLGRGGLADIEWAVQLLQLQYAGDHPQLRTPSTLEALAAIEHNSILDSDKVTILREAWLTVTKVRNALVLVRGKPTDQIPGTGRHLNAVAVAAGWPNKDGGAFLDHYLRVTRRAKTVVRTILSP